MVSIDSATFSDIKKAGSGFSFTGNMSKLAVNDEWVEGYNAIIDDRLTKNQYSSMWTAISSGSEEVGNSFYKSIRNYIDNISNIDTCGIDGLHNFAEILGYKNEYLDGNMAFPIEIRNLVEIFSVNPAYLYNKATDGTDGTLVLSNSILHYTTVEQFLSALKDSAKYEELVNNVFFNTIMEFLNLKTTTFDDSINGTEWTEIWKTDINRFVNRLWNDDITSEKEIYELKERLGVDKSFLEKVYADDIMAGRRKLSDFTDIEQTVLKVEVKNRETRYGDSNAMRYYYMRLFKVVEYFRFATMAYSNAYKLEKYALNENKYSVDPETVQKLSLLKFNYSEYEIDRSAVRKVSSWLTNLSMGLRGVREDMKTQCRKNMMVGTKRLIVDLIRKFILEKIDSKTFGDVRNYVLHSAGLNKKFGVSIIEYTDMTEYFNIENVGDAVKPSDYNLHGRYWDMYDDIGNSFTNDDVLSFYNRLFGDSKKFVQNLASGTDTSDNLYEFLSILFEAGAVSNANSDYNLSSDVYLAEGGSDVTLKETYTLSNGEKERMAKYSGDKWYADEPYVNHKNQFHPSYQLHPFIQAFEEYNDAYTSVMNLVNSYTENLTESFRRLDDRLDSLGNTINFWYNWNDDFSGYSTTYEKSGTDFDSNIGQDGPFNFAALQEFIMHPSEYVNNILNGLNKYYYDSASGKALLSADEIRLEVARLQKYSTQLSRLAGREIYKYGKDRNGNIYILYKDKGERRNRNALGDVWVRLRNHPIAFPLFDLALSPTRFNETSCMQESDNSKLVSVLTKVMSRFDESYGFHFIDNSISDGRVVSENLTLYVGTYDETVSVTKNGTASSYEFTYASMPEPKYDSFNLIEAHNTILQDFILSTGDMLDKVVYDVKNVAALSSVSATYYFRDSVTGEDIGSKNESTIKIYRMKDGEPEEVDNPTGKIISLADDKYLGAKYYKDDAKLLMEPLLPNGRKSVVFAQYDDENSFDGEYYYCINSVTGQKHPCMKRMLTLNKLYAIPYEALAGDVLEDGNVVFGGLLPSHAEGSGGTAFSDYTVDIEMHRDVDVLDGGRVYENFSKYSYFDFYTGEMVPNSKIVMVGGNNPFYISKDEHGDVILQKAEIDYGKSYHYGDIITFSDSSYRSGVSEPTTLSSIPFTSCGFVASRHDSYSDSIGQFYIKDDPYRRYAPYTVVIGNPVKDKSVALSSSPYYGTITLFGRDGSDNHTFYYAVSSVAEYGGGELMIKQVSSDSYTATVNLTSSKLGGNIGLIPYDTVKYPIFLDFSQSNCDNIAVYSSLMSEVSQQKFFDMGFSYDQKLMYLSYADTVKDEYLSGGTIVGALDESLDENYSPILTFHRDGSHNVEFVDGATSFLSGEGDVFHIGDISSKRGIFTAYGKYFSMDGESPSSRYMEISLTLFSYNDVRSWKFGVDIRNGLFEFSNGSKYSGALSCTNDRLYISFTTNVPSDDDSISTTVNDGFDGVMGSTDFGNVRTSFMDCMIQVLSFDITDDEVSYQPSETRYVLGGGEVGYFQQFGGMDGKTSIFTNSKLSTDMRFPVQPQFLPLTADFDIRLMEEYDSRIINSPSNSRVRTFDRYINLTPYVNPAFDTISGFLVEDDHEHAILSVASVGSDAESEEFSGINHRKMIDFSRGLDGGGYVGIVQQYDELHNIEKERLHDGDRYMVLSGSNEGGKEIPPNSIFSCMLSSSDSATVVNWTYEDSRFNHGVNIISDGSNTSNRCAAFIDNTTARNAMDIMEKKMALMPIHSDTIGYSRVDFEELVDSGTDIYSMHSDGKTVSMLTVSSEMDDFNPVSGICEFNFTPYATVYDYDALPKGGNIKNGTIVSATHGISGFADNTAFRYSTVNGWTECEPSEISMSDAILISLTKPVVAIDGYTESATIGGRTCYGICNGNVATWFGAYGDSTKVQSYVPAVQGDGVLYKTVTFSISGMPSTLYPLQIGVGDAYVKYSGDVLVRRTDGDSVVYEPVNTGEYFGSGTTEILLNRGETIETVADTSTPTIKVYNTSRGFMYKYDAMNSTVTLTHMFDDVDAEVPLESVEDFHSVMSETMEGIIVSYWSDKLNIRGVLRTHKTTPDSIGIRCTFADENGVAVEPEHITKFLSVNGVVLAEEENGYRVFVSDDDGFTFHALPSVGDYMRLVGCGATRFYARYGNGEKVYSTDGKSWFNVKNIHASDWSVINASGVDYIACEKYDHDLSLGILEQRKFLLIRNQLSFDEGTYDKMCISSNGDIICIGGMDGASSLSLVRVFNTDNGYSEPEYFSFSYVKDIPFSSAILYDTDLILSPDGGMTALLISHVMEKGSAPDVRFIDISSALNNEINVFGGFGYINGRLVMYPSEGNAILIYDNSNHRFQRIYSFNDVKTLCDCDLIDFTVGSDAILSPRTSTIDGRIRFSRTRFDDRIDYGIIEIDEGFPILVGYSKITTYFYRSDSYFPETKADAYKIVFVFLNDKYRRTVTLLSRCGDFVNIPENKEEEFQEFYKGIMDDVGMGESTYVVNDRTIKYSFESVDYSPKFVIRRKTVDYTTTPVVDDFLRIDMAMTDMSNLSSCYVDYELTDTSKAGRLWVYGSTDRDTNFSMALP